MQSTRVIGEAIARAKTLPRVWLQASTATIYAHRYDHGNDEVSGLIGGDPGEESAPRAWKHTASRSRARWEAAFNEAVTPGTWKVALRSAVIMSPDPGGAFRILLGLVRSRLGGRAGDGRQFVSWVHDQDFINAIRWLIAHNDVEGVVNVASPNPLSNARFMRTLRNATRVSVGLPAARWMLEIGAVFMRTETELVLKSRRVVPRRLLERGFKFSFETWREAARDLVTGSRVSAPRTARLHGTPARPPATP